MDKIYKVTIQGYCIQEEGMEHPENWDWTNAEERWDDLGGKEISFVEFVEKPVEEEED